MTEDGLDFPDLADTDTGTALGEREVGCTGLIQIWMMGLAECDGIVISVEVSGARTACTTRIFS